ncbi:hypothetical protein [Chromobacterium sp. CV08]|uniref:hypothetical protein n=1 Tax=Chromobacterium sp. CV08 TaxID=3133274 RepID=UPI003DA8AA2B
MVFDNTFSTAQSASRTGTVAEDGIAGYIPHTPAESITIPPHDPSKPFTPGPQDPKIVRETSPQAQAVFNLISTLTQTMGQAAVQQNQASNDPATTVDTAAPIMSQADPITNRYPGSILHPDKAT